jgi:serine/threonine protein kinase
VDAKDLIRHGLLSPADLRGPAGSGLARYEILEESGGLLRARDRWLGRAVALRRLPARLLPRAEILARLAHPGIAAHEVVREKETILLATHASGRSLRDAIATREFSSRRVAEIVRKAALALDHAHRHGIVHGDVRPAFILLDVDEPRVTGFALDGEPRDDVRALAAALREALARPPRELAAIGRRRFASMAALAEALEVWLRRA